MQNYFTEQFLDMWKRREFKPQVELEFRAWCPEDKVMIYDLNSPSLSHGKLKDHSGFYIFMQFTTFLDKNGKKIFHGDILKIDDNFSSITGAERTNVLVGFHEGQFMYGRGMFPLQMDSNLWMANKYATVVGNFYENFDLLDVSKFIEENGGQYRND